MEDVILLARIKFFMTVAFHFVFPTISIGLAWLLVVIEGKAWRQKSATFEEMGRFFGKLFGLTFAVGVATGLVMVFQFGTNWSQYSRFVGDVFGAPLAAEAVFAFFMESTFLGLYLFGRGRVSKGVHFFSILMVAVGATISAFWIIVANSWQQTPAGFVIQNGRAEMVDFWAAVFNPSTLPRFFHTVIGTLIAGSFFVAGIAAYYLLKDKTNDFARAAMKISVVFGVITSVLQVFPSGHTHGQQVAATQPEKFAAIMGIYTTQTAAPIVLFAVPTDRPPQLKAPIEIPGVLSWLAFGDVNAPIKGLDEFPPDEVPPLFLTFVSYHNMVILGLWFILIMGIAAFFLWRNTLWEKRLVLKALLWSIPLPVLACQLGWMAAEVGRQPWTVYHLLRTEHSVSVTVSAEMVLFAIVLFFFIYAAMGISYIYLVVRKVKQGPGPVSA